MWEPTIFGVMLDLLELAAVASPGLALGALMGFVLGRAARRSKAGTYGGLAGSGAAVVLWIPVAFFFLTDFSGLAVLCVLWAMQVAVGILGGALVIRMADRRERRRQG
jgi:hypothetical protein